jgi:hypothetical protein
VELDLCGFELFVSEPQRDHRGVGPVSLPRQLRGEPGYEGPKRTRHSYSRHFSHLDRLLSGDQHVGDDLGQAAQLLTPHGVR